MLRLQCGFDLHRVCGRGSFGGVIAATFRGESFAVEIGNAPYSRDARLSVLVEAAVMDFAGKFQDEARDGADEFGTFALYQRARTEGRRGGTGASGQQRTRNFSHDGAVVQRRETRRGSVSSARCE